MLRLLTPLVSTIHAFAIALIFMSVAAPAAANRIEVSPTQLTFSALGESQTVSVRVYDENNLEIEDAPFNYFVIFDEGAFNGESPGDNEFRIVSGGLEITAGVNGIGDISISIGSGESVNVPISVGQVPTTLTVTPGVLTLDAGETVTLQAALSDANGYEIQVHDGVRGGAVVNWESSDSAIATVEGVGGVYNGKESGATADVTAVGEGTVTITANWLGVTTSVTGTTMVPGSLRSRSLRSTANSATLSEQIHVTVGAASANTAPTGLPTISGTARVGETLTASASGIADTDGLTNAAFAWQWIANDGTSDTDIAGATGSTYTLTSAEAGKTIKVRVSFTDDAGTEETLVSAATAAVAGGFTARFEDVPTSHDGSGRFDVRVVFSDELPSGSAGTGGHGRIKHALAVTGGTRKQVWKSSPPARDEYWIRVKPSGDGAVELSLATPSDCEDPDALCTPDGRPLSQAVSATIPGPAPLTRTVSIASADDTHTQTRSVTAHSSQVTEGTAAPFTLTRTGSLADALTVNVSVTETGTMLGGTVPETVTFNANASTAELRVETEDDEVAEPASAVTAALAAGSGYSVDTAAASGSVTVEDDDAVPAVQTAAIVTVPENTTAVATLTATDDDTPVADLAWSIAGGADAALFTVSAGGDLAFASAKDFETPDDADGNGDYEVTVRVTDGSNPVDAALTVRLTDVDESAPVLSSASVNGDALVLTFAEPLDGGSVPAPSAFSVAVDGAARGVSDVSVGGSSVTLTLASAVAAGETVTVGYTEPAGANDRPLQDVAGHRVASFADEAAANATAGVTAELDDLPADTSTTGRLAAGGSFQGSIQAGTAQNATDEDWIAVPMVKGQVYVIDLEGADTGHGTLSDPKINGVAEPNGWHGGASDDNGGEGKNSRVLFTAVSSGDHYIKVAGSDAASVGTYRLSVARFDGDQLATPATTATVAVGGSVDGSIDETRDMDAFKVALVAGDSYKIDFQGNGFSAGLSSPVILGLLDPDGSTIANTSASGGSAVVPTRLRYTAAATGTRRTPPRYRARRTASSSGCVRRGLRRARSRSRGRWARCGRRSRAAQAPRAPRSPR